MAHGPAEFASGGDVDTLVRARAAIFLVTNRNGDIDPPGARELGLFHRDTRHLSFYKLSVREGHAVRLSAETTRDGYNQIDLMLSDLEASKSIDDPKNYLHVRRRQMLDGAFIEQIVLTSFLRRSIECHLSLDFGADFADVFEVRGAHRERRGVLRSSVRDNAVYFAYDGLCKRRYETRVVFSAVPQELTEGHASFDVVLGAGGSAMLEVLVEPVLHEESRAVRGIEFAKRTHRLHQDAEEWREGSTRWTCDHGLLQQVLEQSALDLASLRLPVGDGWIVGGGIPWFHAPFGRDALIAGYEALTLNRTLALEALRTLAAFQGKKVDPVSEEEPGKIFHELRFGEMAAAYEIPHRPYYGSVDATPLFVIVAEAAYRFTGDLALLRTLCPAILAALRWLDEQSAEGTRFVSYQRKTPRGLENQGWKDSRAGVSFPDGRHARPPIALAEVQGYCVDAYVRGARVLKALGDEGGATVYAERAERMRELVERKLWLEDAQRYAYAFDGHGEALPTIVSNPGHLLWSRVPSRERAAATARLLLGPDAYSGYGVRTLARHQPAYNPLSYHNGTVWPHDNALIARGLANYDLGLETLKVFDGMIAAAAHFTDRRIPELFCGFARSDGPLVRYPVACSPQAWAAATPFLMLQSILGLFVDAPGQRLGIRNPRLPGYIRTLEFRNMRIGTCSVGMRFRRVGARCHVDRLDVEGGTLKVEIELD